MVLSGFVERGVGVVGDAFDLAVYGGFGASFLFFVVGEAGVVFVVVARGYFMKRGFFEMNLKILKKGLFGNQQFISQTPHQFTAS